MTRFLSTLGVAGLCYAILPAVAAWREWSDRRGPIIYPELYHSLAYSVVRGREYETQVTFLLQLCCERPLFYGLSSARSTPPPPPYRRIRRDQICREFDANVEGNGCDIRARARATQLIRPGFGDDF